jgi:menaquinone-9 beta-reductase
MNNNHEITIVGGGPAGSAAAIMLADSGFDVCLIEKKNFPRETLCGEFLSGEVIEYLKQFNLYEEFISLRPNPIKYFRLIDNTGREVSAELNFQAFGLRRSVLDNLLLNAVKKKGVRVIQPAEVKEIKRYDDSFILIIKVIGADDLTIKSKYVIAAYGKHNIMDKSLNRGFASYKSGMNGVKFHLDSGLFNEFNKEEIRIYLAGGIYCGVNAVDNNFITVCFLENRNQHNKSSRENLLNFISGTEKFKNLFKPGYEEFIKNNIVWGSGDIYFGRRNAVENGIFMIGDAAGVIAPVTGDGIGMAIQSAGIVSEILFSIRSGKNSIEAAEKIYQSKWNSLFRSRVLSSHIIQSVIMTDIGRMLSLNLLTRFPQILPYFINITRG